jgi:hypothetical protein
MTPDDRQQRNDCRRIGTASAQPTGMVAGLEEVALWIEARGSVDTHDNIVTALGTLDTNAGGITAAIEKLRQIHT